MVSPNSVKVTDIWSAAEQSDICRALGKKYMTYMANDVFAIEAIENQHQIQMRITLQRSDLSWAYPVEVVCPKEFQITSVQAAELILDYVDCYWGEYFSNDRDVYLSIDWQSHKFEELEFFIRGSVRNLAAEKMASELLSQHGMGSYDLDDENV
jgi:hypothetical protein